MVLGRGRLYGNSHPSPTGHTRPTRHAGHTPTFSQVTGPSTDLSGALGFAVSHDLKIDAPTSLQCRTLAAISVEAVNNIIQHAPARSDCSIRVVQQGSTVVAEFTNHTRSARQAATRPSFGLLGIEERARAAGGYITISKPPGYWRLEVTLPSLPSVVDAEPRSQSPAASPTSPPEQGKPSLTEARPTDYRI
ncbi:hypothetical protein brsh051_12600 [Brooklawnia propionicigenes]|uniref:Uncharacterized protein n=1 Tax=Brooklawnia propionicigenes TaxID=3041175 RepID=A0AAN0MGH1_9ACTN|nr:hypothetical protein brsh051_12600 [Brooklawnia sp. SH051]